MAKLPTKLTGQEILIATGLDIPEATVLEFWQWAFSDLKANNLRGIFAEWLVSRLLQIDPPVRDAWAAWDLMTLEGVKIEVKAAAYLQTWEQKKHSAIVFSGLKGQSWHPLEGYSGTSTYNADLYIFCLQTEKDAANWNPLDLSQWRFYVLPQKDLAARNLKTISLSSLSKMVSQLTARELTREVPRMIRQLAESKDHQT